jgi:hypothetical protein
MKSIRHLPMYAIGFPNPAGLVSRSIESPASNEGIVYVLINCRLFFLINTFKFLVVLLELD